MAGRRDKSLVASVEKALATVTRFHAAIYQTYGVLVVVRCADLVKLFSGS